MMTCKRIRKKLSAFLDGEVSPEEGGRIEQHLAICPACATEARALTATYQLLERCPQALLCSLRSRSRLQAPGSRLVGRHGGWPKWSSSHRAWSLEPGAWRYPAWHLAPILTGLLVGAVLGMWLWPRMSPAAAPSRVLVEPRSSLPRDVEAFGAPARDPLEEVYVTLTSARSR
jgi:anti-sigma factor RsiW